MYKEQMDFMPAGSSIYLGTDWYKIGAKTYNVGNKYYTTPSIRGDSSLIYTYSHPGPPYRSGGPFLLKKWTDPTDQRQNVRKHYMNGARWYEGGFACTANCLSLAGNIDPVYGRVDEAWGNSSHHDATGWNKYAPGKSVAELGVFLGELRDLPKMLQQSAEGFSTIWRSMGGSRTGFGPKHVANHFLNQQFGWLPFLSDMRKFYQLHKRMDERINRIRKYNGKWDRRGGVVSQTSSTETIYENDSVHLYSVPTLSSQYYKNGSKPGNCKLTVSETEKAWFEGKFRYYIPDIRSVEWDARVRRQLYGLTISPALLWELTPWSWLADWFTNAGDVFDNMDVNWAENLAAEYAYSMVTREKVLDIYSNHDLKYDYVQNHWTANLTSKSRRTASPFGFGLTFSDLTTRQVSILGALGISRFF